MRAASSAETLCLRVADEDLAQAARTGIDARHERGRKKGAGKSAFVRGMHQRDWEAAAEEAEAGVPVNESG